ncbi:uncharacterized protein A1O5_10588 [Cladophialophora psammophila CBS 110553]|uniref:UBC core domain-containing protein n=1 Tax=Cladophialophora psammophila CBS 110553 TaxID=1182543 RepID=W9WP65_9EURO|nr:uncharacterized protein A1O5_10588 [Cladophialophora psammophila CBS 110553]EXJ66436.1 hypothetical protein A1O5_10588 [Cladophialophora psammophila CBS 110553]
MSGIGEGIAGLAFGAASLAALFTTCIEFFDVVVAGKHFSEEYEQLCALFSLQRVRFVLWGESVGLVPSLQNGRCLRFNKSLERPDIRPEIERILLNIKSILDEAGRVDERYGLRAEASRGIEVSVSRGMSVFKTSFDRFKNRIRTHQKETSAWKVTRWAIHDSRKFEAMIDRLGKYVDGLESITQSLGLLEEQRARLRAEIDTISDVESLRLLRDASSNQASCQNDVSSAASLRLISVTESSAKRNAPASSIVLSDTTTSFVTAHSGPSATGGNVLSSHLHIPGSWPASVKLNMVVLPGGELQRKRESCEECTHERYPCIEDRSYNKPCARCMQTNRECSFLRNTLQRTGELPHLTLNEDELQQQRLASRVEEIPQNQRVLRGVCAKSPLNRHQSFEEGDADYGKKLVEVKAHDDSYWLSHAGKILGQANSSSSAAKRMFMEIRNIRASKVPFISATPLGNRLDRVLASIEGPPETPYEGGIFWITVRLSENDPSAPPMMRFHTKIYHPNISPHGNICADYKEHWSRPFLTHSPVKHRDGVWYPPKPSGAQWTLGALLVAMCALLASPNIDDPLVPEIAQKYIEDYDGYCANARLYTERFATDNRPDEKDLLFLEDMSDDTIPEESSRLLSNADSSQSDVDLISLQESLRAEYDDKFPEVFLHRAVLVETDPLQPRIRTSGSFLDWLGLGSMPSKIWLRQLAQKQM